MKTITLILIFICILASIVFSQEFSSHIIVDSNIRPIYSFFASDVDGDGDIDMLSASGNRTCWHENDGNDSFTLRSIRETMDSDLSVFAIDMDNDGDMDVVTAGKTEISWHENDGNQIFTSHVITTSADYASSVYAKDMEGDGDIDVFSASSNDNKVAWYENDSNQSFTTHIITSSASGASSVYVTDIDGDNDMDVLSCSQNEHNLSLYNNDGDQNFTSYSITTSGYAGYSIYAIDVDDDEDMDLVCGSGSSVYWSENLIAASIENRKITSTLFAPLLYNNYPNPFNPSTKITFTLPKSENVLLEVFNTLGERIEILLNEKLTTGAYEIEFDATDLSSGLYFYRIEAGDYCHIKKMILLK